MGFTGLIYIAGPYSQVGVRSENIQRAQDAMLTLWANGVTGIAPFVLTSYMDDLLPYETFMCHDFRLLDRCEAVLMLESWQQSRGAVREHAHAVQLGIPIFYSLEELFDAAVSWA